MPEPPETPNMKAGRQAAQAAITAYMADDQKQAALIFVEVVKAKDLVRLMTFYKFTLSLLVNFIRTVAKEKGVDPQHVLGALFTNLEQKRSD
jgi:hypothetical protein